ncbi:unnamed protein product, partial [Symbiodinium sp. CCMP2456]
AERLEIARRKEAKRQEMLLRLEVVNQTVRKEYKNCIHSPAKVSFDVEVQEIGQHAAKSSSSSSSSTGCAKPSILKGSKFGKPQSQDGAGKRGRGVPSGEDSPGSSADSVYPEFEGDDDVFFEDCQGLLRDTLTNGLKPPDLQLNNKRRNHSVHFGVYPDFEGDDDVFFED